MKNLKFKRYNVGESFNPTNAERDTLHFVPVSTEPLIVKIYDVDEYGNVAEASFDGWKENKDIILKQLKKYEQKITPYKEGEFTVSDGSSDLTYISEGQYTKIGNQVFFSLNMSVPENNSNDACYIVGLPVATKSTGVASSISGNIVSDVEIDNLQLISDTGESAFRVITENGTILTNAQLSNKNLTINGNYFTD